MDVMQQIKDQVAAHDILIYMKGSPKLPQCGFSSKAVQVLVGCGQKFAFVDVLANPEIRANLPKFANWPTFPQLWVKGELVGGSDIMIDMYNSGDLQKLINEAVGADESDASA